MEKFTKKFPKKSAEKEKCSWLKTYFLGRFFMPTNNQNNDGF